MADTIMITRSLATFFDRVLEGGDHRLTVRAIRQLLNAEISAHEFVAIAEQARGGQQAPPGLAEKIQHELALCPDYLNRQAERAFNNLRLQ